LATVAEEPESTAGEHSTPAAAGDVQTRNSSEPESPASGSEKNAERLRELVTAPS
jgi:hypothetical protein